MGRTAAGCFGATVGRWVACGVLDAGDEDAGGLVGGGEFALGFGFSQELVGVVASDFGIGGGVGAAGGFDGDVGGGEVGEEFLGVGDVGDGGAGARAVTLPQFPQAVVLLDLQRRGGRGGWTRPV
ncbi:hypothetical protein [Streptomyces sp. NPDC057702]|uniref:hypothetical protein n=1 Tax=unclassified Streptomyces TaxID=2593676 RepID=UPI00367AB277